MYRAAWIIQEITICGKFNFLSRAINEQFFCGKKRKNNSESAGDEFAGKSLSNYYAYNVEVALSGISRYLICFVIDLGLQYLSNAVWKQYLYRLTVQWGKYIELRFIGKFNRLRVRLYIFWGKGGRKGGVVFPHNAGGLPHNSCLWFAICSGNASGHTYFYPCVLLKAKTFLPRRGGEGKEKWRKDVCANGFFPFQREEAGETGWAIAGPIVGGKVAKSRVERTIDGSRGLQGTLISIYTFSEINTRVRAYNFL